MKSTTVVISVSASQLHEPGGEATSPLGLAQGTQLHSQHRALSAQ